MKKCIFICFITMTVMLTAYGSTDKKTTAEVEEKVTTETEASKADTSDTKTETEASKAETSDTNSETTDSQPKATPEKDAEIKQEATVFANIEIQKGEHNVTAGILFDQKGFMYVCKDGALLKITPEGEVSTFCSFEGLEKGKDYIYKSPLIWNMDLDPNGNIVAAAQDRILKISPEGEMETINIDTYKGYLGMTGLDCDKQGNIYVTNGQYIEKYTPDLKKSTYVDANLYKGLFTIKFDPEMKYLYATDFYTKKLIRFNLDETGNVVGEPTEIVRLSSPYPNPFDFGCALNITFSENGTLYASLDGMGQVLKYTPDGEISYISLGEDVHNHIMAFGGTGFHEDSIYLTSFEGDKVYEYHLGEKEWR